MTEAAIQLRKETLGGVETNIIQFNGSDPKMPTVFYHPGIFGSLHNLVEQNIPRIALESGCSFLALNTIDQDPDGTYPPRHIDFEQCMKIIEEGMDTYTTGSGIIPVLNSWGTFPTTLAINNCFKIDVKGVLSIGATLNAHKALEAGLQQYFEKGVLDEKAKSNYEAGQTISNIPYPPPPFNDKLVSINQEFFKAHDNKLPEGIIIPVEHKVVCIRAQDDQHVSKQDTDCVTAIYRNCVDPDKIRTSGDHWGDKEAEVGQALKHIISECKQALTM